MMSASLHMLIGKKVGSSSEEETVIVAYEGHPVDLHHFWGMGMGTRKILARFWPDRFESDILHQSGAPMVQMKEDTETYCLSQSGIEECPPLEKRAKFIIASEASR